jgi:ribosomal protein RSM22 (predicted rRNA methylase)
MRTRKGGTVLSVDMDAIEGSDDAQVAVEEYMSRNTVRTRLSKDIISEGKGPLRYDYNEKTTAAYVAARMPAIYGTIYRVLSEVSDFSHCHGQSLARFSTSSSRLGFSCL